MIYDFVYLETNPFNSTVVLYEILDGLLFHKVFLSTVPTPSVSKSPTFFTKVCACGLLHVDPKFF
jgi:hypothetical protein